MSSNAKSSNAPAAAPLAPLPFHFQFIAGAIAGVSEILVMYPLDVVKTRFQLQVGKGGPDNYTSISDCFKKIIKNEGWVSYFTWTDQFRFNRLYRGIIPPIFVEAPKRATKFAANEQFSLVYKKMFNREKLDQPLSILTGVSAGCVEAFLVVSFELVKIRLQDKNNAGKYSGTVDCIKKILKEEGPLTFFKGLEATIWRHGTWNGGYFGVIHGVRSALPKAETKQGELFSSFVAGAIGGTVGTSINTPFDVIKTRIQNSTSAIPKYNWALPAIKTVIKEEGYGALYKGFVPKVLRLGPGGGILLVVFDSVSTFMRKHFM